MQRTGDQSRRRRSKEGKAPASEEKELEAGAVYYWQAEYGGDSLHEASKSTCSKEVETVKATTSVSTKLSGGGKEGEEIVRSEERRVGKEGRLSGTKSSTDKGTIKYAVYKDKECKELATKAGEGEVKKAKPRPPKKRNWKRAPSTTGRPNTAATACTKPPKAPAPKRSRR